MKETFTKEEVEALFETAYQGGREGLTKGFVLDRFAKQLGFEGWDVEAPEDNDIRSERSMMDAGVMPFIECEFRPQEWINDHAAPVDTLEETSWRVPVEEAKEMTKHLFRGGFTLEELEDSPYARDQLRMSRHAPDWVREWSGPFEVDMEIPEDKVDHEFVANSKKVYETAREAFIHMSESDSFFVQEAQKVGLGPVRIGQAVDLALNEWFQAHSGHFIFKIEVDGTGIVTDHVLDEGNLYLEKAVERVGIEKLTAMFKEIAMTSENFTVAREYLEGFWGEDEMEALYAEAARNFYSDSSSVSLVAIPAKDQTDFLKKNGGKDVLSKVFASKVIMKDVLNALYAPKI